ncbi:acyltransferase family protein [Arthrobacter sp. UNC362MFTsu5.1]|jgi:fucose 4-O-acetylase-like acetyltransferase|uniref:acyltransferase family protein n=1 Tax=Arthrobacter sp. UNC362MFTsu5.1 TaxID=1449044 RepID=UPI000483E08D|nr:acyltransferase [Arthrobacter sp. UNC362MFTsu5.1]
MGVPQQPQQAGAGQVAPAPDRDAVIDLARFFCLALVVVGHTMMVSPVLHPDGTVTTENTLALQDWFEPIIWIFMVMPLFFVAGGITGLQSWRRLKARGGSGLEFAQARLLRLIRPAAALLAVMFAGLWAARLFGVEPQVVELIVTGAGMPLWFLAAYLAAQLNIPLLAALHDRAPWLSLAGLTALVVAVDCFRGTLPLLAYANILFLWCAVQQLGFVLADAPRERIRASTLVGVIVASNVLLGLVTGLGLYRGNMLVNLNPPNFCLLLLGAAQAAALQLSRPVLTGVASARWVRAVVGLAGRRAMTVYLWHLPLLAAMSGLLLLTDFPKPPAGTAAWWWSRPLVLLGVIALLLPVLAVFGRLEERPTASVHSRRRPPAAVVTAVVVVFVPVADAALNGLTLALLGGGAACFALAVLLLGRIPPRPSAPGGRSGPLPQAPLSANVEP